jgi:hypothetical protein
MGVKARYSPGPIARGAIYPSGFTGKCKSHAATAVWIWYRESMSLPPLIPPSPPKLPKDVVADARHEAVLNLFATNTHVLWEKGVNKVPTLPLNPMLAQVFRRTFALGHASQGLEQISKELGYEQQGLDALVEKMAKGPQNPRISRLLFMANDGSERFYRECDSLLTRYGQRLLGCRLDLSGEEFGNAIFGVPKLVRAALVFDKKAAAQVLLALVPAG